MPMQAVSRVVHVGLDRGIHVRLTFQIGPSKMDHTNRGRTQKGGFHILILESRGVCPNAHVRSRRLPYVDTLSKD